VTLVLLAFASVASPHGRVTRSFSSSAPLLHRSNARAAHVLRHRQDALRALSSRPNFRHVLRRAFKGPPRRFQYMDLCAARRRGGVGRPRARPTWSGSRDPASRRRSHWEDSASPFMVNIPKEKVGDGQARASKQPLRGRRTRDGRPSTGPGQLKGKPVPAGVSRDVKAPRPFSTTRDLIKNVREPETAMSLAAPSPAK